MKAGLTFRVLALLEANSISGTAKAVIELACEAKADEDRQPELQVTVAIFNRGDSPSENALTRALQAAGVPFSFIQEKGRFDRSVIPQIENLIRSVQADVIWTNSVKSHFLVSQIPSSVRGGWLAFHHGYTSTDFKMRLYNQLDRFSLRRADQVLTVCEAFAAELRARGVGRSRLRIQHMPVRRFPLLKPESAQLRNELMLPEHAQVILSIGRLSHEKGQRDLIGAFEKLSGANLYLVLVGDGPERARLALLAKQSAVHNRILLTGHRDDAKRFYGIALAFALPSYTEGTPNVLLEAMAAGVPIVATAVGGIPELVTDGKNSLLAPSRRPDKLANALQKLVDSPALRNELNLAAQEVVATHNPRLYFEGMRRAFLEAAGV